MVKKGRECVTKPTMHPERSELKPRKAVLRPNREKESALEARKEQTPCDKDDEQINELEDKQKIRAFLKERKARLIERQEKKLEDPAATLPEDLPIVKHRSRTKEGYYIYTPDELKMGLPGSGMTDKCPFDCDCCF
ncbi:hypothetical protein GL50803_006365 [Giardia duodenalis]|uniref:Uncharacterized protein n=1 Tax=Giardia intestinalis (strain ATCC 50803 / WB clone C6) TaxID=184922 RepID=A8BTA0_GIAIC|nr:hypothetical protein GL50803_006365 [Giardia intestinalis]KAE8302838.1 hypothetical protein GL50803_006365 [Giardia intestinalis]|eukprot:XP_001704950.1 Hypothetical protein GL50803_6365 [Giardia lamblia ATCC 50803]